MPIPTSRDYDEQEPLSCEETQPPTLRERAVEIHMQLNEIEASMDVLLGDIPVEAEKNSEPPGTVGFLELGLREATYRLIALRKRISSLVNRV